MLKRREELVLREDDVKVLLYGYRSGYVTPLGVYIRDA